VTLSWISPRNLATTTAITSLERTDLFALNLGVSLDYVGDPPPLSSLGDHVFDNILFVGATDPTGLTLPG
jgi:hypothetical protein